MANIVEVNGRKYNLNWQPGPKDDRDFKLRNRVTAPHVVPETNLSALVTEILDQGNIGSCVWNAFAQIVMMMQKKHGMKVVRPSRLFGYGQTRKLEGSFNEDSGCFGRDAAKVFVKLGCPHEVTFPYSDTNLFKNPPKKAFDQAEKHQLTAYNFLEGVDDARLSLSFGLPFMAGFWLFESFMSADTQKTGHIRPPEPGEQMIGGHEMTIVGHSDARQMLLGVNSWGEWGRGEGAFKFGFFDMPYSYFNQYSDEALNVIAGEQL